MLIAAPPPTPPPPWVNFTALWQIVVLALLAGAGLPALFAIGLRALALPGGRTQPAEGESSGRLVGGSPIGLAAGGLCFLIVLAAIVWSVWAIYESGHPH
jgi:hypothetical protein